MTKKRFIEIASKEFKFSKSAALYLWVERPKNISGDEVDDEGVRHGFNEVISLLGEKVFRLGIEAEAKKYWKGLSKNDIIVV